MFSDRFEELCKQKGVKPGRACTEMGVSRSLAAKWKATGTERPSADVLEKMSAYFGMSIDEILSKEKTPSDGERDIGFDDFTYAMHDHSGDLTDQDKEILLQMARQLAAANRRKTNGETD